MTIHSSPCTASRNLVKAIEVWELDEHRNELVWSSGTYGDLNELDQISRCTTFAHAEGLPGRVWASRSPVVMHDLSAGSFKRSDEATHAGIRCGLGIPCICGDQFRGVLVFLCDDEDELQGALEIWALNDRHELGLTDSYYANLERFARLSHYVKFPRGAGLPGQAWQMRFPRVVQPLATSPAFMRGAGAKADELHTGLALPIMRSAWELEAVVVMLSSAKTPLAQAFEIWVADSTDGVLLWRLHSGVYLNEDALHSSTQCQPLSSEDCLAGYVSSRGKPVVLPECSHHEPSRASRLAHAGLSNVVGYPVYVGKSLVAVTLMYL